MPFRRDKWLGLKLMIVVLFVQACAVAAATTVIVAAAPSSLAQADGTILNEHTLIPAAVVLALLGAAVSGSWWMRGVFEKFRGRLDGHDARLNDHERRLHKVEGCK